VAEALTRMDVVGHWLVYGTEFDSPPKVIWDHGAAEYYRDQGWKVLGPFVPADHPREAV
jgi:hypothetical protein